MWQQAFTNLVRSDIYIALALLVSFLIIGWLVYYLIKRVVTKLVRKSGTNLDNMLLGSLEKLLFISFGVFGLYLALLSLPFTESIDKFVSLIFQAAFIVLGIYSGIKLIDTVLKWYALDIAPLTQTAMDDTLISVLRLGLPIIFSLLGVVIFLNTFGFPVESVENWLAIHGGRIGLIISISILTLFALGIVVPKIITRTVDLGKAGESPEEVRKRVNTLSGVLVTTGQVLIVAIASFMLLSEIGVNIAPVLAGAGILGIAIGFGAQSFIKDIISGIFIISDNQYRVGDVVRIAGTSGLVEEINLKRTVLRDLDGIVHFIPNGEVTVASNFTRGLSRVNMNISVAYGEDLDRVIAVINRVGNELAQDPTWAPHVLKPPQVLRVDNLGDSGIDIKITGDTKPIQQWAVMGELRLRLKRTFDKEGIEIPWPHTKVYFGNSPPQTPKGS